MRFEKLTIQFALVLVFGIASCLPGSTTWAEEISNVKAAELALHRIERLVILRKIDESYQSKFKGLTLTLLEQTNPAEDPRFEVIAEQYPAADGTKNKLELLLDNNGKALRHAVIAGGAAEGAPTWPDKDPVTLAENALHYVIENTPAQPQIPAGELLPFQRALTAFTVTSDSDAGGQQWAVVDIASSETRRVLRVNVKIDGTFGSALLLPEPLQGE